MPSAFVGPNSSTENHPGLDAPPPLPPSVGRKATLMDLKGDNGMGAASGNPQVMTLQALQGAVQGLQTIAQMQPALQAPLAQMISFLQQAVPQGMAGGNPNQVPAAAPPQGGPIMAPMPPPGGGLQ